MVESFTVVHRFLLLLAGLFLVVGAANALVERSAAPFLMILGGLLIVLAAFAIVSLVQTALLGPLLRFLARPRDSNVCRREAPPPTAAEEPPEADGA